MVAFEANSHDPLERLRELAVELFQQRGLNPGAAADLEKDSLSVGAGEYLVRFKLLDRTVAPPVEITLMRGTGSPLKCMVVDSSDRDLVEARIVAMLDRLQENDK